MTCLYNEIEPFAAQWLRNLMAAGHLEAGDVDERSIADLQPADVLGRPRAHFFAGIGVWAYALAQAGWPSDVVTWTGSCPCQPFSAAGKRGGFADKRHLWPEWFRLIRECRPQYVFGEQVGSRDGQTWFDLVSADLEGCGYAVGAVVAPAAGFGAPHQRHRLYFCAVGNAAAEGRPRGVSASHEGRRGLEWSGPTRPLADADAGQSRQRRREPWGPERTEDGGAGDVADPTDGGRGERGRTGEPGHSGHTDGGKQVGPCNGFWRDAIWLPCSDGKSRPTQPGLSPLVDGAPNRVGRLRAYGNALCAPQAIAFVKAVLGTVNGQGGLV